METQALETAIDILIADYDLGRYDGNTMIPALQALDDPDQILSYFHALVDVNTRALELTSQGSSDGELSREAKSAAYRQLKILLDLGVEGVDRDKWYQALPGLNDY